MAVLDDVLLPASLCGIMFSMGLSLTFDDFRRVFVNRRALLVGSASILVVAPLVGTTIAVLFAPSAALTVGFILLATTPGGMLSNLMTDLAKGDLALSLALTVLVSGIYVLLVPVYAYLALSHFMGLDTKVAIPLGEFFRSIATITVLPVLCGLVLRRYLYRTALRIKNAVKLIAVAVLLYAFGDILVDQLPVLRDNFGALFAMTVGMNLVMLATAIGVSRAMRLTRPETTAVAIEHLIRQEGTAIFVAVTLVGNREMSLPMIMNTPVALVLCIGTVLTLRHLNARAIEREAAVA